MLPGLDVLEAKRRAATEQEDPTAFLLADHEWLRDLLETYRSALKSEDRLDEVRAAMVELRPLLDVHIRLEEEAYFPAIEPLMKEIGQGSTFDMYGEHDAIRIRFDQLLEALERGNGAAAAYAALARSLLVHFENEEDLIFAEAPKHLTPEARREVLDKFDSIGVATSR
ncbi:MAG TPA: hemerythrin domain-containing protein [Dehalococcoidia bacterium]|nr:hemerythrin domain-containing protein [Dehalococcoidia bacterium]